MTDEFEFGPKMRVLTEKQRAFVMIMVEFPGLSGAEVARRAGYSDTAGAARVRSCNMLQDKRIVEAIQEQAGKRMWAVSLKAVWRVEQLVDNDDPAVALKAALSVLDRVNLGAIQNIKVDHTHVDQSGKAIMERIKALADKHGLDAQKLLTAKPVAPTVDAEFSEVKDG